MQIKSYAAMACGIEYCDIKKNSRKNPIITARKIIAFQGRQLGYTHLQIADMIGRTANDSSYLIRKVREHIETRDHKFLESYNLFRCMFN